MSTTKRNLIVVGLLTLVFFLAFGNLFIPSRAKMPLIVPGLQTKDGKDELSKWENELLGKTIGDKSDETVSLLYSRG